MPEPAQSNMDDRYLADGELGYWRECYRDALARANAAEAESKRMRGSAANELALYNRARAAEAERDRYRLALEAAQGEAYLGALAGDDTPDPLAACHNVMNVCSAALDQGRGDG